MTRPNTLTHFNVMGRAACPFVPYEGRPLEFGDTPEAVACSSCRKLGIWEQAAARALAIRVRAVLAAASDVAPERFNMRLGAETEHTHRAGGTPRFSLVHPDRRWMVTVTCDRMSAWTRSGSRPEDATAKYAYSDSSHIFQYWDGASERASATLKRLLAPIDPTLKWANS